MVVVCGKVNAVERAATKTTYHIEDHSGTLEVYTELKRLAPFTYTVKL